MNHAERATYFVKEKKSARRHDEALWHVRKKRDRAAAAIPEWEELRRCAGEIKQHTLDHLGEYLETFERNAIATGTVVHWASDAREANEIVHSILRDRGVTRVVKSKSMLTEECGLNPYLEQRGVEIIDTDLGERIVQMRDEAPSHIVFPAIHLSKQNVGDLFAARLGTEEGRCDPPYLTEAARGHLRQKFLGAEAGITGVNFAVASTGGVVVCTNEGNADLGTSLPPLHIACMGIEKVVPGPDELAVLLRLLARSATGQSITAYTSHFRGPRPGHEMHVVIVDNGRTGTLSHGSYRTSLRCIRCGACMNTCPVYRRSGGHSYDSVVPGPIGSILGPKKDPVRHQSLPFACSTCGSCTDICPVGIDLHRQLLRLRSDLVEQGVIPLPRRLLARFAALLLRSPFLYRLCASISPHLLRVLPKKMLLPWTGGRELPEFSREKFRDMFRRHRDQKP